MSLKRRLEGEIEVHEGAGDLFHDIFRSKPHDLGKISPHFVQGCDLHHGTFGSPGSIIQWKFTVGGKQYESKNKIEEIDDEKKLVRQRVVEGDLLKEYKNFSGTTQVIPKGKETSIVKISLDSILPFLSLLVCLILYLLLLRMLMIIIFRTVESKIVTIHHHRHRHRDHDRMHGRMVFCFDHVFL